MTDTAIELIVETPGAHTNAPYTIRRYRASRPVTIAEVWAEFAKAERSKPVVAMAGGTVRVTF